MRKLYATDPKRPLCIAIAGPNGAGKSTFFDTQLKPLRAVFVNADNLARQLGIDAYKAATAADSMRRELQRQEQDFVFETVFSDPVGDKVAFLKDLAKSGYQVVLCFIGIPSADVSEQRVSIRVSKGGHDVPSAKIQERYSRTLLNLKLAMQELPEVRVFDNEDLDYPYRLVIRTVDGKVALQNKPVPDWLKPLLPKLS